MHWSDTVHLLGLRQPVDLHQDETELPLFSAQQVQLIVILTDFKVQGDFLLFLPPKQGTEKSENTRTSYLALD